MGAYKHDVVAAIKMGVYIHGCLFCVGAYFPILWYIMYTMTPGFP